MDHPTYRADVDGLRAIAVIGVLLFHVFPGVVRGGFIGVDIFFVISGYLITGILLKEDRLSLRRFYIRRVRRIFPALAVVLVRVLAAGWWLLLPQEYRALGKHTFAGAAFMSNVALWRESGYFDTASETKPLLHLWSLGVEEQYYFFWPIFIALSRRRPRALVLSVGAILAASATVNLYTIHVSPSAAFYLPFSRIWELATGGLVAALQRQGRGGSRLLLRESVSVGGLAAILTGFALINGQGSFIGFWAPLPVAGTAAALASGPETWLARRVLSLRGLVWVGLVSYPLYLWHWPLLALARDIVGGEPPAGVRLALAACAVALAYLTYRFVEKPLRRPTAQPRTILLCASIGVIGLLGLGIHLAGGLQLRVSTTPTEIATASEPGPCPPSLTVGDGLPEQCRTSRLGRPSGALIGDSHAQMLFASMSRATPESWLLAMQASCPPVLGIRVESDVPACARWNEGVLSWLRSTEADEIRTVVIGSYFGYALETAYAADHVAKGLGPPAVSIDGHRDEGTKARLLESGLDAYLAALLTTGKDIILVEDGPEFPFLPSRCANGLYLRSAIRDAMIPADGCSVALDATLKRRASYLAMIARIKGRHPELRIVNALEVLCDGVRCPVAIDGRILYRDSHHLSEEGAALVVAALHRASGRTEE